MASLSHLTHTRIIHIPHTSVPLPKLLPKVIRQPLIRPKLRRPPHEPPVQHVHLLPLGHRAGCLQVTQVPQRGGRPALLREGAVEDDGALVGELAAEGGEECVEGSRGDVLGCLDVASYVVFPVD